MIVGFAGVAVAGIIGARDADAAPSMSPQATLEATGEVPAAASPTVQPDADPYAQLGSTIAVTRGEDLVAYAEPGGGDVVATIGPWSAYGLPTTLLAVETADVDGADWLKVSLPIQPNGAQGWIAADAVDLTSTTSQVRVYLAEHELDVRDAGEVVFSTVVATGAPESPTPTGVYSITDPVDFQSNPTGVFGAYALGTSAFSEAVAEFWDGPPQIALHGTNEPQLLGQDVSNGCIRMSSEAILELKDLVDLGTPVIVFAARADDPAVSD